MHSIPIGTRGEASEMVSEQETASAVASGAVPTFATPAMIALMERASVNAIRRFLDEGQDSVGTLVNVTHLAPTPVGLRVQAEAEVTAVDGRKIMFKVRASDPIELIGEGTHERVLVDRAKFISKAATKGRGLG